MVHETEKNGFALAATLGEWFEVSRQVLSQSKLKPLTAPFAHTFFP